MAKGLELVEFHDWNNWFQNDSVTIWPILSYAPDFIEFTPNLGVVLMSEDVQEHGIVKQDKIIRIKNSYHPCKIKAKNSEQTIALELLRDPEIRLVTITGSAGSGKTLLACAHALEQLRKGKVEKIIIAKSLTPVGREIGFLKGSMEEKVLPWLGPFKDNFVQCGIDSFTMEMMIEKETLEITPVTFIQGRSIHNAIMIIDEAQNMELNVLKQIITRAAEGTKVILLGDLTQVFEKLKEPGLNIVTERGLKSNLIGHIDLVNSLRSPLADWGVKNL